MTELRIYYDGEGFFSFPYKLYIVERGQPWYYGKLIGVYCTYRGARRKMRRMMRHLRGAEYADGHALVSTESVFAPAPVEPQSLRA